MPADPKVAGEVPVERDSKKIETLPLGDIIHQAVTRCALAQQAAALSMLQQIESDPFMTVKGKRKPAMLRFDCQADGKKMKVRLPLITVVPPQFIQIRDVEIDFNVTIDTKGETTAKRGNRPDRAGMTRMLPVRMAPSVQLMRKRPRLRSGASSTSTSLHNNISVKIKASNLEMSGGMARLLELAGARAVRIQEVKDKR